MTSMTDKGRFAHLLYRAMESKGLNQKALSERSGVHQSQISRYTNFNPQQQRIPSYETLMDLIDALDCGEAERSELVIGAGYSAYDSRLEGAAEQVDQIATNTAEIKSHTSEILGILKKANPLPGDFDFLQIDPLEADVRGKPAVRTCAHKGRRHSQARRRL